MFYKMMITDLTFIEFLKIVLSFYPYILGSLGIILGFWILIGYIQIYNSKNKIVSYSIDEILR